MKYLIVLALFATLHSAAQTNNVLLSKVTTTPDDVLQKFHDAGMSPTAHPLTKEERRIISKAFEVLPPLHQRVLKQHLKSISFLDNMPNTALTSPVSTDGFHITFRAGILHQTISAWATEKENTCFAGGDSTISVAIQAGSMPAFTYVLLHEGTHVVDGALQLLATDTTFAKNVWKNMNTYDLAVNDSIALKSRFRADGRQFLTTEATRVYAALGQTPFASLYSTASWHEDLAELLTIYHLTQILQQPFRVVVKQDGKEIYSFAPLVQKRAGFLQRFYDSLFSSLGGITATSFSTSFCTTCTAKSAGSIRLPLKSA